MNSQHNFSEGQYVWYKTKISIINAAIKKIENEFCEFNGGDKIPKEKCYHSIEKLIEGSKKERNRNNTP